MCLLKRDIYDLEKSSHAWFAKFSGLLTAFGYKTCNAYEED